jgi:hypothetical protein
MPNFITPIYDRTYADILNRANKAYFNVDDWVRIYGNSQIINTILSALFGTPITFNTLSVPDINTIPSATNINDFVDNIENLREYLSLSPLEELTTTWLSGSSAAAPDYEDVNAWERSLDVLFYLLPAALNYSVTCGVGAVGQPRFYQARWRVYSGWVQSINSIKRAPRTGKAISGTSFTRQNYFRMDGYKYYTRMNVASCGQSLVLSHRFRRYA